MLDEFLCDKLKNSKFSKVPAPYPENFLIPRNGQVQPESLSRLVLDVRFLPRCVLRRYSAMSHSALLDLTGC